MKHSTDAKLLSIYKTANPSQAERAFAILYRRYEKLIAYLARKALVRYPSLAKDITVEEIYATFQHKFFLAVRFANPSRVTAGKTFNFRTILRQYMRQGFNNLADRFRRRCRALADLQKGVYYDALEFAIFCPMLRDDSSLNRVLWHQSNLYEDYRRSTKCLEFWQALTPYETRIAYALVRDLKTPLTYAAHVPEVHVAKTLETLREKVLASGLPELLGVEVGG